MIKHLLVSFFFVFLSAFCFGQNLVPNPSFENFNYCPHYTDDRYAWQFWTSFGGTPDVFNICEDSSGSVPINLAGHQMPSSGNSYGGLIIDYADFDPWHEYLAVPLTDSLVIGVKYFVSIKISLADCSSYASNNLGIGFSTDSFPQSSYTFLFSDTLTNYLKINSQIIITDSVNWTTISGSFTADSAYKYLVLGNFMGYHSTNTIALGDHCLYATAYYYVDDVCVTADSAGCDFFSAVSTLPKDSPFLIFPNPAGNELNIKLNFIAANSIQIFNSIGQCVFYSSPISFDDVTKVNTQELPDGIYFLQIDYEQKIYTQKISKLTD